MMKALILASLALALVLFPSSPIAAATVAGAGIEVDEGYVGGYTITWDGETREELVRQLSRRRITFERDLVVPLDPQDPDRAVLEGKIRILSRIRSDRQVMASTSALVLVRREGGWFVDAASLRRALEEAPKP